MTALIIILAIIFSLSLISFIPITVKASYDEEFNVSLSYTFFNKSLIPSVKKKQKKKNKKDKKTTDKNTKKEKSKKTKKEKSKKTKKDNMFVSFYNNSGFLETVKLISDVAKVVREYAHSLLIKRLVVKELKLNLTVCGDDSADTAVKFGEISSAVYPSLGFLISHIRVKKHNINIKPDFINNESKASFYVCIKIKPFWAISSSLYFALRMLKRLFKMIKVNSSASNIKNKYVKKSMKIKGEAK